MFGSLPQFVVNVAFAVAITDTVRVVFPAIIVLVTVALLLLKRVCAIFVCTV